MRSVRRCGTFAAVVFGSAVIPFPTVAQPAGVRNVISIILPYPGAPNDSHRIKGSGRWPKPAASSSPESIFSEALLKCGQRKFDWYRPSYGGGRVQFDADRKSTRVLRCLARTAPFDFWVYR